MSTLNTTREGFASPVILAVLMADCANGETGAATLALRGAFGGLAGFIAATIGEVVTDARVIEVEFVMVKIPLKISVLIKTV